MDERIPKYAVERFSDHDFRNGLKSLEGKNYLNDTVLAMYASLLERDLGDSYRNSTWIVMNPQFFTLVKQNQFRPSPKLSRIIKRYHRGNVEKIYIPTNMNDNHWILHVVNVKYGCVHVCDSLGNNTKYVTDLCNFFTSYYERPFEDSPFLAQVMQQKNEVDCGVYTLEFILRLTNRQDLTDDIPMRLSRASLRAQLESARDVLVVG